MIQGLDGGTRFTSNGKRALVCGAGGFIGGYLVRKLKQEGYWVRGVDIRNSIQPMPADEFKILDLCWMEDVWEALRGGFDEVYQLAAHQGGLGYTPFAECEIMHDNVLINTNMIHAAAESGVPRYFFSSSVCVYRDMGADATVISEAGVYPAQPDNEYGWEKLYTERMLLAYARRYPMQARIARFESAYGPYSPWEGGQEKVLPALCRKAIDAKGPLEIWGDGTAVRPATYVTDTVNGVYALMQSDLEGPVNIGADERPTVNDLADAVIEASGKKLTKKYVEGPVGVQARNFSKARIRSLGWEVQVPLGEGIRQLYAWVEGEMRHVQ